MSTITPIFSEKIKNIIQINENPNIQDKALDFLKTFAHKNIKKTFTNNIVKLNYEDLCYYLQDNKPNGEKLDYDIVAIYWKLNYDNANHVNYRIVTNEHNESEVFGDVFRKSQYYNLILSYSHLTNCFDSKNICMYSYALYPEKTDHTGVLMVKFDTSISIEIANLDIDDTKPVEIDIVIQYHCPDYDKIIKDNLLPLHEYDNFMQVIGQSKNMNLLSKKSLFKTFGKLDDNLIVNICEYLL